MIHAPNPSRERIRLHDIIAKYGTGQALASALGIGPSAVYRWLRRESIPLHWLAAVGQLTDTDPRDIRRDFPWHGHLVMSAVVRADYGPVHCKPGTPACAAAEVARRLRAGEEVGPNIDGLQWIPLSMLSWIPESMRGRNEN